MRRLVVFSALLILAGLALLLPTVPIWSLLTSGSSSPAGPSSLNSAGAFRALLASSSGTDNTTTEEALAGFGAIGVGLILEVFSLFTDVGAAARTALPAGNAEENKA